MKTSPTLYAIRVDSGIVYVVGSMERPPLCLEVYEHAEFEYKRASSGKLKKLFERYGLSGGFVIHGTAAICLSCGEEFVDCKPEEYRALVKRGLCVSCGKFTLKAFHLAWKGRKGKGKR